LQLICFTDFLNATYRLNFSNHFCAGSPECVEPVNGCKAKAASVMNICPIVSNSLLMFSLSDELSRITCCLLNVDGCSAVRGFHDEYTIGGGSCDVNKCRVGVGVFRDSC
jgi:hypothetical protein